MQQIYYMNNRTFVFFDSYLTAENAKDTQRTQRNILSILFLSAISAPSLFSSLRLIFCYRHNRIKLKKGGSIDPPYKLKTVLSNRTRKKLVLCPSFSGSILNNFISQ